MANILIAGCGYIGTALGSLLAAEGQTVWGLRRDPATLPSEIRPWAADLTSPDTLQTLPPAIDWVVYSAAPDTHDDTAYRSVYVDGLNNLLHALTVQQAHPRRVFLTSSTGVYGESSGAWVDETSPTEPREFGGIRLLEGERLLLDGPFPATVLRLGGLYGPGRASLIEQVRRGEIAWDNESPVYFNRIHRDDAAGALRHLMTLPRPDPVYVGVDHEPTTLAVLLDWLADALGVSPTRPGESSKTRTARHPANKRCRNAKLVTSGYTFHYPTFREGYTALLTGQAGAR
ncbi:MAG: SDR family oxidoreductase [Candidatus Methylomirabilis oxygeniifera]|uniref:NAD-dependent epimerase/dehydratase n=1 Tax=Methylomirabilis oxygeniifera TaxID=671143 RepID=D5MIP3_METO1|nr:MAG: SDR family oxidoreductase [Candidatus Methylomirabilis oxyfera]CBE69400.1 NAD-dependent epimerase/dehydratase [Candidatus Methylomirabilis oxyfera]